MIQVKDFATIISSEEKGLQIFNAIESQLLGNEGQVVVDMSGVVSMATFCSKQIFGKLYKEMGSEDFYSRVLISNASEDIKTSIRLGIISEMNDRR